MSIFSLNWSCDHRDNERPLKNHIGRGQKSTQHTDTATTRPTRPRGPSWWKSRIRETLNLLINAYTITMKRKELKGGIYLFLIIFNYFFCVKIFFWRGSTNNFLGHFFWAWNWSCDFRANERPRKKCTRWHRTTDWHSDSMTDFRKQL